MARIARRALVAGGLSLAAAPAFAQDLPWDLPPLRTAQIGSGEMAYFEAGSGPPLVLLHGLGGSAAFEWGRVIGPLSKHFRVIAPYQIGFAPSGQPDLLYDARTFVTALGGFMRARHQAPNVAGLVLRGLDPLRRAARGVHARATGLRAVGAGEAGEMEVRRGSGSRPP